MPLAKSKMQVRTRMRYAKPVNDNTLRWEQNREHIFLLKLQPFKNKLEEFFTKGN